MFLKRPKSCAEVTNRKVTSNRGDQGSFTLSSERTEKMTFVKQEMSLVSYEERSEEVKENTRLDSQIEEEKGARANTGDYTKQGRFSIPPLFMSTHKTTTHNEQQDEMSTVKHKSYGNASERSEVESSFSENVVSEGGHQDKMKFVRVEEIKLMHTEMQHDFTTEKLTHEASFEEEKEAEFEKLQIPRRRTPHLVVTDESDTEDLEVEDEEEEKGSVMESTVLKPWGIKRKCKVMDDMNSESVSESWDSNSNERHFIDTKTHFIVELAMICFPFLEGQPDSFFAAYESILNGYSFISN